MKEITYDLKITNLLQVEGGGGNSYTWYTCACPGYGSICGILPGLWVCFVNFALVMGLLYEDLPQLWINVSNL